ncbi:TadE/TadG family type IV pilus assembly protein [Maritimibacter sp. HL-12]|uniref:TadE/TadG family type IV pilus assembly protein n=1 Tax=Maritimibacter sp. HL-12 TaxID=1162418 RepID=UPI000A0F276A|nr:pilus assembly protein TadG-related protein [Maritimibacter sp. HL-12]SMH37718.1 Putative Flp pilus-assembly TadE/G-like [Maritimibacter sp. HL-12]
MTPECKGRYAALSSVAKGLAPGASGLRSATPGSFVGAFTKCESGAVAVIAGLAIPVLLGFAGLALEYGQHLVVRAEAQRTADLAAHAGAVAYSRTGGTGPMVDAANRVARLNGFSDGEIVVELDASIPTASGTAVRATVTAPKLLLLPRLVGGDTSVDVVASAVAGALGGAPACIQALDPDGSGISLSGGASVQSQDCAVASNAGVEAPCGTSIITEDLSYNTGPHPLPEYCQTIRTPDGGETQIVRQPTSDPLAGSDAITRASEQIAMTEELSAPDLAVVATGPDIDFGWNQGATIAQAEAIGCTASFTYSGNIWTFSCPGLSTVNIGRITLGGGLTLDFNPGASQETIYNLSGGIRNNGARMTFAGGTYNVAEGINTGGGSITEFGAGTYRIGRSTQNCSGAYYSICNTSELVFDGPSDFVLPSGVWNSGGSVLTLGTGTGNSFRFGPSSDGDAIALGGGSQTFMGDVDDGVFEVAGWIDGGGGGSCLVIPEAELHEINGSIVASGAIRFGAGLYVVNGYMHLGGNGGGSAMCGGETISVEAENTTFVISAAGVEPGGWSCRDQAFCVTAGYSNVRFTAPQSGPFTDLAVIGPLDPSRNAGALFAAGASGSQMSGALYFPNDPITLTGGASANAGSAGCLQLIAAEITMSGGTSVASECDLPQSGGAGQVALLR